MCTVAVLEHLLAIVTPIGMCLLRLRDLARLTSDVLAARVVSAEGVQVAGLLNQHLPHE